MATILITGGTGFIGSAITRSLTAQGDKVVIMTRDVSKQRPQKNVTYASWDVNKGNIDGQAIAASDHIIHLAGANVAEGRWTKKRKREIRDSRVKSGALLVKALTEIPNHVQSFVSASAIGFYGPDPQIPNPHPFRESDPPSNDFLGSVVQEWESVLQPLTALGKRLVMLRTGIVLSKKEGAYAEFRKPLRFGLATILGSGQQIVSWIHIDDLVRMYLEALRNQEWSGACNAVAPAPVSNKELVMEIARQRGKFFIRTHVPSFVLKALLGEMSIEVLKSTTVSSAKAEANEFIFYYPSIGNAIQKLEAF